MLVKELPLEFIGKELHTEETVYGDLVHCGYKTYIKRNNVPEPFDTIIDLQRNCIEVDPNSVVMVTI